MTVFETHLNLRYYPFHQRELEMSSKSQLTYRVRARKHPNVLARRLFEIAEAKQTNVTVSADVTTTRELLELCDRTPNRSPHWFARRLIDRP